MIKLKDLIMEGARDPGIFKAIFLAGGPGSGKSYVASQLFGIPDNVNSPNLLLFFVICLSPSKI